MPVFRPPFKTYGEPYRRTRRTLMKHRAQGQGGKCAASRQTDCDAQARIFGAGAIAMARAGAVINFHCGGAFENAAADVYYGRGRQIPSSNFKKNFRDGFAVMTRIKSIKIQRAACAEPIRK